MRFMDPGERELATALARLSSTNPFVPERVTLERTALGDGIADSPVVWSVRARRAEQSPNLVRLAERARTLADRLRDRLLAGAAPSETDRKLYEDVVFYALYNRVAAPFWDLIERALAGAMPTGRVECWTGFHRELRHFLDVPGGRVPDDVEAAHLFASFFQVRRAFHFIFWEIVGGSMPAARLRAAVWESIFTRDMRRYSRALYARMGDITTLVVGPSGTGKELVARAIALSRYVPFDVRSQRFATDFATVFHPLNLSALAPTLVESELFGHRRGAFTGAIDDRVGWLEACEPLGTVFLDEVGDVDAGIQVKLLRVLQSRTFERLGDSRPRTFTGKLIAATNRDLGAEMHAGHLRSDFYYRLCADVVETPSLAAQLRESPDELPNLVRVITGRIAGEAEADAVAREVTDWIDAHLGADYDWPGNVRELEQCVRNVMVRGAYRPHRATASAPTDARAALAAAVVAGSLTADELLSRYASLVFAESGSYQETARRLDVDRRTARGKVDPALVARFRSASRAT